LAGDGAPVGFSLLGKKIVAYRDLLFGVNHRDRPVGSLVCVELSGALRDPTEPTDLVRDFRLFYLEYAA
jgi:hypothetical protein